MKDIREEIKKTNFNIWKYKKALSELYQIACCPEDAILIGRYCKPDKTEELTYSSIPAAVKIKDIKGIKIDKRTGAVLLYGL